MPACRLCNKKNVKASCSGCKSVFYCDKNCQLKDWMNHKLQCQGNNNLTLPFFDKYLIRISKSKQYQGYGIIANIHIPAGTIIHCEKPLISLPDCIEKDETEFFISQKYQLLSTKQKNIYQSLSHSNHTQKTNKSVLQSIWNNNVIQLKQRQSQCIFPLMSRINHKCDGNAHWIWNEQCNHLRLITLYDINKNTEITVNYIDNNCIPILKEKREHLLKEREIKCKCDWCWNDKVCKEMDGVIEEYQLLDESLESLMFEPLKGYKTSLKLIEIVSRKFNSNPMLMDKHCYDAAQFALGLMEWNDALYYLQMAFKYKQIAQGQDAQIDESFQEKLQFLPNEYRTKFHCD